jgi:GUN4-like/Trypsin-like peptidase domain
MNQIQYDLLQAPYDLLKKCTVRIEIAGEVGHGTGFFVAPKWVLTCFHVVKKANTGTSKPIQIFWQNQTYPAETLKLPKDNNQEIGLRKIDLALLKLQDSFPDHPCVFLDESTRIGEKLYSYGYTDQHKDGDSATFECEGFIEEDGLPLIKFKMGQVRPGASGSPLLNFRTKKVCGIVKLTRDRSSDLGGGAISAKTIFDCFPEIIKQQQQFHQQDNRWVEFLPSDVTHTSLEEEFYWIIDQLDSLGAGFGKQVPVAAKRGFQYLLAAVNSDDEKSRNRILGLAIQEFMSLINVDIKDQVRGVSDEPIEEKFIAALGYWGNFRCFDMLNEKRNSIIQVYEYTKKYFNIGIQIFPLQFFSEGYIAIIEEIESQLEDMRGLYEEIKYYTTENCYLMQAGKVLGIVGLIGGGFASAFFFKNSTLIGSASQGAQVLFHLEIPEPKDEEIDRLKKKIDDLIKELQIQKNKIISECEVRIQELSESHYKLRNFQHHRGSKDDISQSLKRCSASISLRATILGVEYTNLENLLKNGAWKAANFETWRVMVLLVGWKVGGLIEIGKIRKFPCVDLRIINDLWVRYSNGRFGFSVQNYIWLSTQNYDSFCTDVGWTKMGNWDQINYDEITWSLEAPKGHLPIHLWVADKDEMQVRQLDVKLGARIPEWENCFFSRCETCKCPTVRLPIA